jgi:hypothetical protein
MSARHGRMAAKAARAATAMEEDEEYQEGAIHEFETETQRTEFIVERVNEEKRRIKKQRMGSLAQFLGLYHMATVAAESAKKGRTLVNQDRVKKLKAKQASAELHTATAKARVEKLRAENLETFLRMFFDLSNQISAKEAAKEAAQHAALQSLADDPKKATDLFIQCSEKACKAKNECEEHEEHEEQSKELTEARFNGHAYCFCEFKRSRSRHRVKDCPQLMGGSNCHHVMRTAETVKDGEVKQVQLFMKRTACPVCSPKHFCEHGKRLAGSCPQCGRHERPPTTKRTLRPETEARALLDMSGA